jgi:hypothetical protein
MGDSHYGSFLSVFPQHRTIHVQLQLLPPTLSSKTFQPIPLTATSANFPYKRHLPYLSPSFARSHVDWPLTPVCFANRVEIHSPEPLCQSSTSTVFLGNGRIQREDSVVHLVQGSGQCDYLSYIAPSFWSSAYNLDGEMLRRPIPRLAWLI